MRSTSVRNIRQFSRLYKHDLSASPQCTSRICNFATYHSNGDDDKNASSALSSHAFDFPRPSANFCPFRRSLRTFTSASDGGELSSKSFEDWNKVKFSFLRFSLSS